MKPDAVTMGNKGKPICCPGSHRRLSHKFITRDSWSWFCLFTGFSRSDHCEHMYSYIIRVLMQAGGKIRRGAPCEGAIDKEGVVMGRKAPSHCPIVYCGRRLSHTVQSPLRCPSGVTFDPGGHRVRPGLLDRREHLHAGSRPHRRPRQHRPRPRGPRQRPPRANGHPPGPPPPPRFG